MSQEALMRIGLQHEADGEYQEAMNCYRSVLETNPGHASALLHIGIIFGIIGDYDNAISAIGGYLRENPQNAAAWRNIAVFLEISGRKYDALGSFGVSQSIDSTVEDNYLDIARLQFELGSPQEALNTLDSVYPLCLKYRVASEMRVNILLYLNRYDEARQEIDQAVRIFPDDPQAYACAGNVSFILGDKDGAKMHYLSSLEMDERNFDSLIGIGCIFMSDGNIGDAEKKFLSAADVSDTRYEPYLALSGIYFLSDDMESLDRCIKRAYSMAPLHPLILYFKAVSEINGNRPAEASRTLEAAIKIAPNHQGCNLELANILFVNEANHQEVIDILSRSVSVRSDSRISEISRKMIDIIRIKRSKRL